MEPLSLGQVNSLGSFVPVKDSINGINVLFEVQVIDKSLWSYQIGGTSVYKRQLIKSVAHNEQQLYIPVTAFLQAAIYLNFPRMKFQQELDDQSQETNLLFAPNHGLLFNLSMNLFSLSFEEFLLVFHKMWGGPQGWSMDQVHEGVHGLGPQGWSMDLGSMLCIHPVANVGVA